MVNRSESVEVFGSCSKGELRLVERLTERVTVPQGTTVVTEGESDREFFLIQSGEAVVTREGKPVNSLGRGDFFGELTAFNRGTRNATVTALTDLDLLVIGVRESDAILKIPQFRNALLNRMASRLQTVDAPAGSAESGESEHRPNSRQGAGCVAADE
jgi:CRP/FNR family transcriptional regulator, cyclic AMP receptor protein